jgi:type IV pilus assembly protein PilM
VIDLSTSLSVTSEPSQDSERITLREVNIVKNIIDNWADEFERVFKYYTSRNTEKDVKKILIHGGVTQIKGFGAYLSKIMGIPVEQIQKLNCVKVQDSSVSSITSYLNTIGAFIRR